jgi:hypothetical protein
VSEPTIKVMLDDGTDTWVTVIHIRQRDLTGALDATGEAFAWFVRGLVRDEEAVNKHLEDFA